MAKVPRLRSSLSSLTVGSLVMLRIPKHRGPQIALLCLWVNMPHIRHGALGLGTTLLPLSEASVEFGSLTVEGNLDHVVAVPEL
jgi:hypothetical protein